MKYYIIAGEASGDLHGSNLIASLLKKDPTAEIRCWGGDKMEAQGGKLVKHYRDLAFMGFFEVAKNLPVILRNIRFCKKDLSDFQPDAIIFIDYPGFNLRIAKWAHKKGFTTYYYISPQLWAWHPSRAKSIREFVDRMFVILPFEKDFYRKWDYETDFVGHPLLDAIHGIEKEEGFAKSHDLVDKPIIALLPGSRKQEIQRMLPVMLQMQDRFPDYQFVVSGVNTVPNDLYQVKSGKSNAKVIFGQTYQLLMHSHAALVTSGTATLETALFNIPEVVCYKGEAVSFAIGKRLVKVDYISLVNIIMEKEVVSELIQKDFTPEKLESTLRQVLETDHYNRIKGDYSLLREKLGGPGASDRTAELIQRYLNKH